MELTRPRLGKLKMLQEGSSSERCVWQGDGWFFSGTACKLCRELYRCSSCKLSKLSQNHSFISKPNNLTSTLFNPGRFLFCFVICLFWYVICALIGANGCLFASVPVNFNLPQYRIIWDESLHWVVVWISLALAYLWGTASIVYRGGKTHVNLSSTTSQGRLSTV